ncbi:hypothetical protein AURDEDRAFT_114508 [Auricularia subglabra TFB-10046 SS5]|nr:hypothetical protein AURDEDRAFT_114508 [Auricularia subglabra TFB-10046 SS5]
MAFAPSARRLAFCPTAQRLAMSPTAPRHMPRMVHPKLRDPAEIAKAVAKTASTPHKVRLQSEAKTKRKLQPGEADMLPDGLMRGEAYKLLRARMHREDYAADMDDHTLLASLREREYRIRGIHEGKIVGKRIFLPNIIFRLVRNPTPKGHPYNPFEATFRVPPSITKLDIRSYLHAMYGLDVTYIRTDNHPGWVMKAVDYTHRKRGKIVRPTHKRAVVGLREPFYYPLMLEDMSAEERKAREEELERDFQYLSTPRQAWEARRRQFLRIEPDDPTEMETRKEILGRIRDRRAAREAKIEENLVEIRAMRPKNEAAQ